MPKAKRKSLPSKETILATWWGPLGIENRKDRLEELTHGKLRLPPCTDRCWSCGCLEDHPWYDNGIIQRCHIVADSLGGSNEPLNFLLLCEVCHLKSPDTTDPRIMFDWLEKEYDLRESDKAERLEEFKKWFPLPNGDKGVDTLFEIFKIESSKEFSDFAVKNSTWHFGMPGKWSTHYGLLSKFVKEKKIVT